MGLAAAPKGAVMLVSVELDRPEAFAHGGVGTGMEKRGDAKTTALLHAMRRGARSGDVAVVLRYRWR